MLSLTRENYPLEYLHQLGIMKEETWFDRTKCGIDQLNQLGGLYKGLNVVAARPGMGTHSFVASIAANLISVQHSVVIFSQPYNLVKWKRYLASNIYAISQSEKGNDLSDKSAKEIDAYLKKHGSIRIVEYCNYEELEYGILQTSSCTLVVIDSLQEIHFSYTSVSYEDSRIEANRIAEKLATLSIDMKTPFILLSQLNRNPERRCGIEGKVPQMGDLRDCDIEQYAKTIIFLFRPEYYHVTVDWQDGHDIKNKIQVIVDKNFDYPNGDFWLDFDYKNHRIGGMPVIDININHTLPF